MKRSSFKKAAFGCATVALSCTMLLSVAVPLWNAPAASPVEGTTGGTEGKVRDVSGTVDFDLSQYLDTSVVQKLPETVSGNQEISVILSFETETVLESYDKLGDTDLTIGEYAASRAGKEVSARIAREGKILQNKLKNAGVPYTLGNTYDTLLGGFEVLIGADKFDALCSAVRGQANVMVGEVYEECKTELVENVVNVYEETGIFDSSDSDYDGTGTVIAVLDTGLDYTHSAFSVSRFTAPASEDVITMSSLRGVVSELRAAEFSPGLNAAEVYISRKVPYAYDYADKDAEVLPINSEHGTHVAGVMVGKDDRITGVAPNAQLAVMKVFSESNDGARQSWIMAALEDCVTLGVDVINMSLGTSVGFSREVDEWQRQLIYDSVKERGISLVAAASNDYNATFGSEKNGNLPLTTNPDSATVGAPSTYDSALSVASIKGVKTPYMLYNGEIIYFTESADRASEPKNFVEDILDPSETSHTYDYVIIPGVGRMEDYMSFGEGALSGKIALVKRGQTNFEEKARIALEEMGAAGVIIYNNVSGDITMTVGAIEGAVCSISRDDGEKLVAGGNGQITISRDQVAGPFMSDFSSWGPTPDLGIKPEITAHGGDILSAVPGQGYERLSGTSMASPNQAGVTALVRQYVKEHFGITGNTSKDRQQITAIVNQLMMSTADIAKNTNGVPFAVRKQGAGLTNLGKATSTPAYIETYDREGKSIIDKAKIELGDDPDRSGEYVFKFNVVNISDKEVSYRVGGIVMTEGVSTTLTARGDKTVTETGYLLDGAKITVTGISAGSRTGDVVTVAPDSTAVVTCAIRLGASDKEYLERYFDNGMYVEGFVQLTGMNGEPGLNVPYLAFYGSWSEPPMFDLDYFATNKDELDDSIDQDKKIMADAYATRPVGGLYGDYIYFLGAYGYVQNPASSTRVAADRDKIALTNQEGEMGGVNSIYQIWCGMLRAAKQMTVTITDSTTGEVIFYKDDIYNQMKSYNSGGAISASYVDVGFNVRDYNLKNNTKYNVTLRGLIDYGDGHVARDTFEFPFYTDFTAPIITNVEYNYEYDSEAKKNKLYADVSIFDNHYVQGVMSGYIMENEDYQPDVDGSYRYSLHGFDRYITPVVGSRNSTSTVRIELTDHLDTIKKLSYNHNSFMLQVMDYAGNQSTFELPIPSGVATISFPEEEIRISPNQTYTMNPEISPSQEKAWVETLNYESADESIVRVVGNKIVGVASGVTEITVRSNEENSVCPPATVRVRVLSSGDEGYRAYDRPVADAFRLESYTVLKEFYTQSNEDSDLGKADEDSDTELTVQFMGNYNLRMFPSESIQLNHNLTGYFEEGQYEVRYSSSNPYVATVDEHGVIVARNVDVNGNPVIISRSATIYATLWMKDTSGEFRSTIYSQAVGITVKEPYTTSGPYLTAYRGLGGRVEIPESFGVTEIAQYAFSNYRYVPKDLAAGDEISKEDPYNSKITYVGENTITEVVIPEGVKTIQTHAFAALTALEKVVLPSTLTKIQSNAFYGCVNLTTVEFSGKNNLQFISEYGFFGCPRLVNFPLDSIVAVGDYALAGCGLTDIVLPKTAQSVGAYAFAESENLSGVEIKANIVKVGTGAFAGCGSLQSMIINTSVIPAGLFYDCPRLNSVLLGADVSVIAQYAFSGTNVSEIIVDERNPYFESKGAGTSRYLVDKETRDLVLVSPLATVFAPRDSEITRIGTGAFTAARNLTSVTLESVTEVGDYAFADCNQLKRATFAPLEKVGVHAFEATDLEKAPRFAPGVEIGDYAFAGGAIPTIGRDENGQPVIEYEPLNPIGSELTIPENATIGAYAFASNTLLTTVTIGDVAPVEERGDADSIGAYAFYYCDALTNITIGDNATIGAYAFAAIPALDYPMLVGTGQIFTNPSDGEDYDVYFNGYLSNISSLTIGDNAKIGSYAFLGAGGFTLTTDFTGELTRVDLGDSAIIGDHAFYACTSLEEIDLSTALEIGDEAFAGFWEALIILDEEATSIDEAVASIGGFYVGAFFEHLDLSAARYIGEGAFQYMGRDEIDETEETDPPAENPPAGEGTEGDPAEDEEETERIPIETSIVFGDALQEIGAHAFYGNYGLKTVDLSNIDVIGDEAFGECDLLESVTLKEGALIGAGAFANCTALSEAENLSKVGEIGARAFEGTAFPSVDLSGVGSVGDFAFRSSAIESVVLNPEFRYVGENPFAYCNLPAFRDEDGSDTFSLGILDISDGVLYRNVPNGKILVCYPILKEGTSYTALQDTVRIGDYAFAGAGIVSVELPRKVASIGDRAFVDCNRLAIVTCRSLEAPALEEAYDERYDYEGNDDGVPYYMIYAIGSVAYSLTRNGVETEYETGLKIVPYRMWSYDPTSVFYGANFVAPIGTTEGRAVHEAHNLTIVRPSNGTGYENYLYEQYFDVFVEGMTSETDETVELCALIDALPATIDLTVDDEDLINELLSRYDAMTNDQKALLDRGGYYDKLLGAKRIVDALKAQQQPSDNTQPSETEPSEGKTVEGWVLAVCITVGIVAAVALIGVAAFFLFRKSRKEGTEEGTEETEPEKPEEGTEPAEETEEKSETEEPEEK